jgi:hypothetical protein
MPSRGCDSLSSEVYHAIVILSEAKDLWDSVRVCEQKSEMVRSAQHAMNSTRIAALVFGYCAPKV